MSAATSMGMRHTVGFARRACELRVPISNAALQLAQHAHDLLVAGILLKRLRPSRHHILHYRLHLGVAQHGHDLWVAVSERACNRLDLALPLNQLSFKP
eukprot:2519303-Prymnesium_polylepis.2